MLPPGDNVDVPVCPEHRNGIGVRPNERDKRRGGHTCKLVYESTETGGMLAALDCDETCEKSGRLRDGADYEVVDDLDCADIGSTHDRHAGKDHSEAEEPSVPGKDGRAQEFAPHHLCGRER